MAPIWCGRYCQRVPQSEEVPGSVTIKITSRKCNNQNHFKDVSQSKVLPGSAVIMGTARQFYKKVHPGSATIKSTSNESTYRCTASASTCHDQKHFKEVSQSKELPER